MIKLYIYTYRLLPYLLPYFWKHSKIITGEWILDSSVSFWNSSQTKYKKNTKTIDNHQNEHPSTKLWLWKRFDFSWENSTSIFCSTKFNTDRSVTNENFMIDSTSFSHKYRYVFNH